jgi:V-type H+-transporting ATPase subunit E
MPPQPAPGSPQNDKQVYNMVAFLKSEAQEKIMEIKQKAIFAYRAKFLELCREKQHLVDAEYKQKRQNSYIQRLIDSSHKKAAVNGSLIALRSALVDTVKETVIQKLDGIEKNAQYSVLLTNLIVEGLISVQEETIQIRCRKIDEDIVKKILKNAEDLFKKAVSESTGYTPVLAPLTIDTEHYLPGPYKVGAIEYCLGGVEVVARKGKIVCKNTLDARLELAFKHMLPYIRAYLFGEITKKVNTGELPHHLTNF